MKNTLRAATAAISLGTIGSAYAGHVPVSGPPVYVTMSRGRPRAPAMKLP